MLYLWAYGIQVLVLVVMPPFFFIWLVLAKPHCRMDLYARGLGIGSYLAFFSFAGRWDIVGVGLRLLWLAAFVVMFGWALRRHRDLRRWPLRSWRPLLALVTNLMVALFFLGSLWQLRGYEQFAGRPISLLLPLRDTAWYVAHGGSVAAMNHHTGARAQTFALDITGLNSFGVRAKGLLPSRLEDYVIFGKPVVAPCSGRIRTVEAGLPDLVPPRQDEANPAGNHVLVQCGDATVLLAHLRQNSVKIRAGTQVQAGQQLAEVGNSGHTTEPHLHVHAVRGLGPDSGQNVQDIITSGQPVPMLFNGRFLTRNSFDFEVVPPGGANEKTP